MITIVTGFPRSGTSLTMQMLAAAGVKTIPAEGPAYEDDRATTQSGLKELCAEANGCAIKVLDMHRNPPPIGPNYAFLWCVRDPKEQAKSLMKFLQATMPECRLAPNSEKKFAISFVTDTKKLEKVINQRGGFIIYVPFEVTILTPERTAQKLATLFNLSDSAIQKMASVVLVRSPKCYPGMLENRLLSK